MKDCSEQLARGGSLTSAGEDPEETRQLQLPQPTKDPRLQIVTGGPCVGLPVTAFCLPIERVLRAADDSVFPHCPVAKTPQGRGWWP